jgi:hypothetical protein
MPKEPPATRLPGLRRGLPLIFLGLLLLVVGLVVRGTHPASALGTFPVWLYCLPIGIVALVGGVATSFFPEVPEKIQPGAPVAEGLIAVRASDWLAIQRLLRTTASGTGASAAGAGAPGIAAATPAGAPAGPSGTSGTPTKDLMATSFAFAPAFANDTSNARRKRAGLPVRKDEAATVDAVESSPPASTASTGP